MSLSTVAGMFYMQNPETKMQCSEIESNENMHQESDEDNTSCSASEMGCDLSLSSRNNNKSPLSHTHSSRKNKRKNFKPRNILEYAGSDEEADPLRQKRAIFQQEEENETESPASGSIPEKENGDLLREQDSDSDEYNTNTNSPVDGPLDLSEVQDYSSKSWSKSKAAEALAVRNLLTNLNNNVNLNAMMSSSSFLNHSIAAAAAAANMASVNANLGGMDLRTGRPGPELYEDRSSDPEGEGVNSNNNNHPVLTDFAENTMKELLSLYGITQEAQLRQGGKPGSELLNIHGNLDTPPGHPSKLMLPENMARLLAAMQESMPDSGSAKGPGPSNHNNHHHPLSFANINSLVHPSSPNGGSFLSSSRGETSPGNGHLSHFSQKQKSRGLAAFPVIREGLLGKGAGPIDYTRYVRRFGNAMECGQQQCRELNYREHFHCQECSEGSRVFVKKEEMIRHFKWHKKRDESLQHGFMRYSPMDDCSEKFGTCSHNRKQTHYHCLKDGCEKVYISTSDVQMHANYHRKDSAIIQEGFQRFRAAEDCGSDQCTFRHQKTTHFHCRRPTCSFTFKNKADMEKHKSYHIKDEQLNRDGFKKFMKHEECLYPNCRFSRVCNHIHCIREGCNYVLHSSGQLYSHKRKHERRDAELAYRKYKLAQSLMKGSFTGDLSSLSFNDSSSLLNKSEEESSRSSFNEPVDLDPEEKMKKTIQLCSCDEEKDGKEHFHCKIESCRNQLLATVEGAAEHFKNHEMEDRISSLAYFTVDPANFDAQDSTIPCISAKCPYQSREKHYHCLWDSCAETVLSTDEPFKRLTHFKSHQLSSPATKELEVKDPEAMDGFFRRKRGRPPKNRVIEVNEAIYTSFKLPKKANSVHSDSDSEGPKEAAAGFTLYPEGSPCGRDACPFLGSSHYHCGHQRCHAGASDVQALSVHLREYHAGQGGLLEGFECYEFWQRGWDCGRRDCALLGKDHYHCLKDPFSASCQEEVVAHEERYHNAGGSSDEEEDGGKNVVKARGTFYPTYSLDKSKIVNSNGSGGSVLDMRSNGVDQSDSKSITDHSLSRILQIPQENGETQFGPDSACGRPFCKLKRKHHFHCHLCNQAFSDLEKLRPHVLKHSNVVSPHKSSPAGSEDGPSTDDESFKDGGEEPSIPKRPSSSSKLQDSLLPPHPSSSPSGRSGQNHSPLSHQHQQFPKFEFPSGPFPPSNFLPYPPGTNPYLFLQQSPLSLYAGMMFGHHSPYGNIPPPGPGGMPQLPDPSGLLGSSASSPSSAGSNGPILSAAAAASACAASGPPLKRPPSASSSPSSPSEAKKARMQMRILKDEPVPEGYIRFRFNEDCAYVHCGYREHQTHFHCTREDCGYSFCDKTRFVQHTARHERLDTLMGGDFKQFRANVSCGRPDCAYRSVHAANQSQNKASHFHCSKCDFVCTDTNKVVAHRRQHQKLDSIMAAGFEKFTPSQNCVLGKNKVEGCIHSQKQTHYHCLKCGYAVLGLSQMSAHKYRHAD